MFPAPSEPCVGSFTLPLVQGAPASPGECAACGAPVVLGYGGRVPLHAPAAARDPDEE